jgi:outer membrane autotransporter protein
MQNYNPSTRYHGSVTGVLLGADYRVDDLVIGAAASADSTDLTTPSNSGTFSQTSYALSPYAALALLDSTVILDAFASVGRSLNQMAHYNPAVDPFPTSAHFTGNRYIAGAHVSYQDRQGDWDYQVKGGYTLTLGKQSQYTDTSGLFYGTTAAHVGELSLGPKFGYTDGDYHPYASLTYLYDLGLSRATAATAATTIPATNSRTEVELGLGMDVAVIDSGVLSIDVTRGFLRRNEGHTSFLGSAHFQF